MIFDKIKRAFSEKSSVDEFSDEYIEIDLGKEEHEKKIFVKLFALKDYDNVSEILNILREGYTIAIIDIKTLKTFDFTELSYNIYP